MNMVIAFPRDTRDPRGSICPDVCCSDLDQNTQYRRRYRVGQQAVACNASRLLTRAVLYPCPNAARFYI